MTPQSSFRPFPRHRRVSSTSNELSVNRKVSILDFGQEDSFDKENQRPKVHFRTAQEVKMDNSFLETSKRWITTKSIERLLSNGNEDSLVHSIGTTS